MVRARFFDGDGENGQPVEDMDLAVIPKVGETIRFRYWDAKDDRYRITAVEYLMERGQSRGEPCQLVGVVISMQQL